MKVTYRPFIVASLMAAEHVVDGESIKSPSVRGQASDVKARRTEKGQKDSRDYWKGGKGKTMGKMKGGKGKGKGGGKTGKSGKAGNNVIGAIFTATNTPPAYDRVETGNEIVMFHLLEDGSLTHPTGKFMTKDTGINFGSSQNSIIASGDYVFVANGANNPFSNSTDPPARESGSVSSFQYTEYGALLRDNAPSGGENPATLALCDNILYVGNAAYINGLNSLGGTPGHPTLPSSITALYVEDDGSLTPLEDLTQDLGAQARIVDLVLTADHRYLLVSVSGFRELRSYHLNKYCKLTGEYDVAEGVSSVAISTAEFYGKNYAYAGDPIDGAVTALSVDDGLAVINNVVGPGAGVALCWTVLSGKYLYTTNAGSGTISSFVINTKTGEVLLLDAAAAVPGADSSPLDMYVYGCYLYVLLGGLGYISVYRILEDGSLEPFQTVDGSLLSGNNEPDDFERSLGLFGGFFY